MVDPVLRIVVVVTLGEAEDEDDDGLGEEAIPAHQDERRTNGQSPGNLSDEALVKAMSERLADPLSVVTKALQTVAGNSEKGMKALIDEFKTNQNKNKRDRTEAQEEDVPVLTQASVQVKDDNDTVIDGKLRFMLGKNPNYADPTSWWTGDFGKVSKPQRGEGLCLNHLGPGFINKDTVYKL